MRNVICIAILLNLEIKFCSKTRNYSYMSHLLHVCSIKTFHSLAALKHAGWESLLQLGLDTSASHLQYRCWRFIIYLENKVFQCNFKNSSNMLYLLHVCGMKLFHMMGTHKHAGSANALLICNCGQKLGLPVAPPSLHSFTLVKPALDWHLSV